MVYSDIGIQSPIQICPQYNKDTYLQLFAIILECTQYTARLTWNIYLMSFPDGALPCNEPNILSDILEIEECWRLIF